MTIISREQWGALGQVEDVAALQRRGEVVIHTAAGGYPGGTPGTADDTFANESRIVRDIEHFHSRPKSQGGRGWGGIAYSFLVAPSGRAYEGRGWGRDGAHTQKGRNNTAYAICFLGHGDHHGATELAWEAAADIIRDGLAHGKLTDDYVVTGHRNYAAKSCPGDLIYPHIGRLRGLTATPPDDEEFDMKPEDQQTVRDIVREEIHAALFERPSGVLGRTFPLANEIVGAAINAKDAKEAIRGRS